MRVMNSVVADSTIGEQVDNKESDRKETLGLSPIEETVAIETISSVNSRVSQHGTDGLGSVIDQIGSKVEHDNETTVTEQEFVDCQGQIRIETDHFNHNLFS